MCMPLDPKLSTDRMFSPAHLGIVVGLWLPFTLLTLVHALETVDQEPNREWTIALTTLATPAGPFLGAISRHGESGCLAFSFSLLPVCGSALFLAVAAQWFIPTSTSTLKYV